MAAGLIFFGAIFGYILIGYIVYFALHFLNHANFIMMCDEEISLDSIMWIGVLPAWALYGLAKKIKACAEFLAKGIKR